MEWMEWMEWRRRELLGEFVVAVTRRFMFNNMFQQMFQRMRKLQNESTKRELLLLLLLLKELLLKELLLKELLLRGVEVVLEVVF